MKDGNSKSNWVIISPSILWKSLNWIKQQLINASEASDPKIEKQIIIEEEKEYQNAKEEFESSKLINSNDFSYLVRRKD